MLVPDTHPLLWFFEGKHSLLSSKALKVFEEAISGRSAIYIPSISFWEIAILSANGKIRLDKPFDSWANEILSIDGFNTADLDNAIISLSVGYSLNNDIFDKAIVATAVSMDLPLITKDTAISESGLVEVYW